jgi:hypothetical protein
LLKKVNSNPGHFFEVYLKCKGDWGQVRIHEEKKTEKSSNFNVLRSWYYSWQLDRDFPPTVANAFREELEGEDPELFLETCYHTSSFFNCHSYLKQDTFKTFM